MAWIAATVMAQHFFPSLNSVAQQDNTSFLAASSPSLQAARLAIPFQGLNQTPVPVVVARADGALTGPDPAAIQRLTARLATVTDVQRVRDLGLSRDGQAAQLQVLASVNLGSEASTRAVNLGQDLSIVFILVLLLFVFRSVLAPLLILAPAVLVTQLAGPVIGEASKAGLQVSSLTWIILIILTLGAGTDYGLFLVFRVREELRAGRDPHDAVTHALSRVGESITFSAATVIAALLTLLLATFGLYSSLGVPLAIGIALMLLAGSATFRPVSAAPRPRPRARPPQRETRCSRRISPPPAAIRPMCCCALVCRCGVIPGLLRRPDGSSWRCPSFLARPARST